MRAHPSSDWDTPADGDFARYVEQLTAQQATASAANQAAKHAHTMVDLAATPARRTAAAQADRPGGEGAGASATAARRSARDAEGGRNAGAAVPQGPEGPVEATQAVRVLRRIAVVLVWLMALQALALWWAGWGSWAALLGTAMLWGLLRRAQSGVARLQSGPSRAGAERLAALQQRLRELARQRGNDKHL